MHVGDGIEDEEGAWGLLAFSFCCHHRNAQPVQLVLPALGRRKQGVERSGTSLHFVTRFESEKGLKHL